MSSGGRTPAVPQGSTPWRERKEGDLVKTGGFRHYRRWRDQFGDRFMYATNTSSLLRPGNRVTGKGKFLPCFLELALNIMSDDRDFPGEHSLKASPVRIIFYRRKNVGLPVAGKKMD